MPGILSLNKIRPQYPPIGSYPKGKWAQGLRGYWRMNEGAGIQIRDVMGNQTATLQNTGGNWINSKLGPAISLSGANPDYFIISPNGRQLFYSPLLGGHVDLPLTIAAWVYWIGSTEPYNCIVENYSNSPSGYSLLIRSDQTLAFYLQQNSFGFIDFDGVGSTIPFNEWTFIVAVYDPQGQAGGGTGSMKSYINGELDQDTTGQGQVNYMIGTPLGLIGASQFDSGRFFNGYLGPLGVWKRVLGPTEIQELYRDPYVMFRGPSRYAIPGPPPPPVTFFEMVEAHPSRARIEETFQMVEVIPPVIPIEPNPPGIVSPASSGYVRTLSKDFTKVPRNIPKTFRRVG